MELEPNGQFGDTRTIAIIGGGFSGSMLAVQLLRLAPGIVPIVLIEPGPVPGRGVAYGTQWDGHLLNVRASGMSAYADCPEHFVRWAQQNYSPTVKPEDFLPRQLYGQYIVSQLQQASASSPEQLHWIRDEAVSLASAGGVTHIGLKSGKRVRAGKVILALGNFPPRDPALSGKAANSARYISNPWSPNETGVNINRDKSVLLIGSGLTSVDVVIQLRALGFKGTIHVLSRHGLLPQSHKAADSYSPMWGTKFPLTVRSLVRLIRRQVNFAETQGADWRSVVDSLRPFTHEIWRNLPLTEKQRFLRHVRPYWEVHRHRIAECLADQFALEIQTGQLRMDAGRIIEYREDHSGVEVSYRDRKCGKVVSMRVDRVVNCTGPDGDCRRVNSPLLTDLLNHGLARVDGLSLGLDLDDDGALMDAQGTPSNFLYALGPLRKGKLWESIAVPEIRVQIAELAQLLTATTVTGMDPSLPTTANSGEGTCTFSSSI